MKIISRKLALAAGIGLAALAGPIAGAGMASASTSPVVYGAHLDPWHAYVKPATFYFGNGAAPRITNLTWKSWGSNSAWGTGKIWTIKAGCSPSYKCSFSSRWVGMYLSDPKYHGKTRYYDKMSVELSVGGKMRWETGYYGIFYPGATAPYWEKFPNVWPYL